jgi:hypothetical protein
MAGPKAGMAGPKAGGESPGNLPIGGIASCAGTARNDGKEVTTTTTTTTRLQP